MKRLKDAAARANLFAIKCSMVACELESMQEPLVHIVVHIASELSK
ncbi:MAG: hypothetical protein ABIF01_02415 [Candidatus Micrarchaeota archaeon]